MKQSKIKKKNLVVADPNLNGYNGTIINGSHSRFIYDYVIDYDYSVQSTI